jgi:hypothetical protein
MLKELYQFQDLRRARRVILKYNLKKLSLSIWIGFIWRTFVRKIMNTHVSHSMKNLLTK